MIKRLIHYKIQDSPNPIWIKRGKENDYFAEVTKTFMGRDALSSLLYSISKETVLLPAYLCKEVTSEFIKYGYKIFYYDLNKDFTIDIDSIKRIIINNDIEVFYYVIYFGMYSRYDSIAKQLKSEIPSIFIIEDRAHYLSNSFNFSNCDAYIFSFRKALPIAEGGGVATRIALDINYKDVLLANLLPIAMTVKKILFGYHNKFSRSNFIKDSIGRNVKPMSLLSNKIIQRIDYEKEYSLRRASYYNWIKKLLETGIEPLFLELNIQDIPLGCPILIENAANVQLEMEREGYYLKRHWPLSTELEAIAPNSLEISRKIITLPIYNGITERDQDKILQLLVKKIRNMHH